MTGPPGLSFTPSMPFYWRYEQSGKMKQIIVKFLHKQALNQWELETLRWYVKQWIEGMPNKPPSYSKVLLMSQDELMGYLSGELLAYGIDPL